MFNQKLSTIRYKLEKLSTLRSTWTVINVALILAMTLSLVPPRPLAAQSGGTQTFLPAIIGGNGSGNDVEGNNEGSKPVSGPRQLAYSAGQTYTYDWSYSVEMVETAQESGGSGSAESRSGVTSLVDITILEKSADGTASAVLSLRNTKAFTVDETGAQQESDDQRLQAELAQPLAFTQAANGQILEVQYAPNASTEAVNFQKAILNAIQLTVQEGDQYDAVESGYQGQYTGHYSVDTTADAYHINRFVTDEDYAESFAEGEAIDTIDSTNYFKFVLDKKSGVLSSVTLNESISIFGDEALLEAQADEDTAGVAASLTVETEGSLTLIDTKASEITVFALNNYQSGGLAVTPVEAEIQALSAAAIAAIDVEGELELFESDSTSPRQFMTLLELVEVDALSVAEIATRLQNAESTQIASSYADVLGAVGTTAAQKALTNYYANTEAEVAVQEQILFTLALQEEPSAETVNMLHGLTLDTTSALQENAALALGAVGESISESDSTQALSIANTLSTQLRNADDAGSLANSLQALGNLGHPSTLSLVASHLDNSDADVRGLAIDALRNMPDAQAASLLVDSLQNDPDADVVAMAAETLQALETENVDAFNALVAYEQGQPEEDTITALRTYEKNWGYTRYGHQYLGVDFPGYYYADSKAVSFYAVQTARAHIFTGKHNIAKAVVRASKANGTANAYIKVGSAIIARRDYSLGCNQTRGDNLYNAHRTLFRTPTLRVPISGPIGVNFKVKGTAHLSIPWSVSANFCSPSNTTLTGAITPQARANVKIDGTITLIGIGIGGATLDSDLMNAQIPAKVEMTITSYRYFNVCREAKATLQPVSIKLKVWAGRWFAKIERTPWTYESSAYTYTILGRRCLYETQAGPTPTPTRYVPPTPTRRPYATATPRPYYPTATPRPPSGPSLPAVCYSRPTLRQSSGYNYNVVQLQQRLAQKGHYTAADGYFGPGTKSVVQNFQRSRGLYADGIVGPNTWSRLCQ